MPPRVDADESRSPGGHHMLVELHGCNAAVLNDAPRLERLLRRAAARVDARVLGAHPYRFAPKGVTVVVVVAESHLSIHTWPDHRYAAVDFFTCAGDLPGQLARVFEEGLEAQRVEYATIVRGDGLRINDGDSL